jgi:hypothetical protein
MMETVTMVVAGLPLANDQPTQLSFADLATWVIWQFPARRQGGLCGAVRPSLAGHGWYPALIFPKEKYALVYGHLGKHHPTPEEASDAVQAHLTA